MHPRADADWDAEPGSRLTRTLRGLGCDRRDLLALAVMVTGALLIPVLLWLRVQPTGQAAPTSVASDAPAGTTDAGVTIALDEIVVHVAGEVSAPGLYRMPGDGRVADALAAAGGPLPTAALDAVNLARPLRDGEQLLIPAVGVATAPGAPGAPGGAPADSGLRPDGLLDLNRATPAELEDLPGIGPVLAERIVAHREEIGGYTDIGQLRDVTGIGERRFQELAELVAV